MEISEYVHTYIFAKYFTAKKKSTATFTLFNKP